MSSSYIGLGNPDSPLTVALYFLSVDTVAVTEIEQCLTACNARTDGSCQGFYLAQDGVTCHVGSFEAADSGVGSPVSDALYIYSLQQTGVGNFIK